jgi:hypothetical protein
MLQILAEDSAWWLFWCEKTFGRTIAVEPLSDYAARVYSSEDPDELGTLVAAFGRSANINQDSYLAAVESMVISQHEYASTLKGMKCLILVAKCYLDFGQPKRAWLTYRRGLMLAQLLVRINSPHILL